MRFDAKMTLNVLAMGLLCCAIAPAAQIQVTITNLAPATGANFTPVWVGFHNGTFDLFNSGAPASMALERLAEDGNNMPLMTDFTASGAGAAQSTLGGGPIAPGGTVSTTFTLDPMSAMNQYFSYASMIVPSNDAFIANGNPTAFQIFSAGGMFLGADFIVLGSMVWDAGTEVNDEIPMNTALLGQTVPNTGVAEGGVVMLHPGFLPPGSGGILDVPMFAGADFTAPGYQIAHIQVSLVPEPSTLLLSIGGLAAVCFGLKVFGRGRRRS